MLQFFYATNLVTKNPVPISVFLHMYHFVFCSQILQFQQKINYAKRIKLINFVVYFQTNML